MRRPLVAAHRGGALVRPENSLAAFRHAVALGCDLVELDVHATADDRLAVIHDATLERTTTGTGPVRGMMHGALRAVRLRDRGGAPMEESVPLLEDVLALLSPSPANLLLEVKGPTLGVQYARGSGPTEAGTAYPGVEAGVLACLRTAGLAERTTIMAFNPGVVTRTRALAPSQRLTFLVARGHVERVQAGPEDVVRWAAGLGATDLGVEFTLVSEALVRAARVGRLALGAWTVNDADDMGRMADLGVDVLTTDRPDVAMALFPRP